MAIDDGLTLAERPATRDDSIGDAVHSFLRGRKILAAEVPELIVNTSQAFVRANAYVISVHSPERTMLRIVRATEAASRWAKQLAHMRIPETPAVAASEVVLAPTQSSPQEATRARPMVHTLRGIIDTVQNETWVLTLLRGEDAGRFTDQDVRALHNLMPMFSAFLRLDGMVSRYAAFAGAARGVMERMALGILLLDRRGRVVGANESARAVLAKRDGVFLRDRVLSAAVSSEDKKLRDAMGMVLARTHGEAPRALSVSRSHGEFPLQLILIGLAEPDEVGAKDPVVAVFVSDPDVPSGPDHDCLRAMYGLTRVECKMVDLLCGGLAPAAIANQLNISVHTVRAYLKSIFQKLGVHRQAGLVRLMMGGASQIRSNRPAHRAVAPAGEPPTREVEPRKEGARAPSVEIPLAD